MVHLPSTTRRAGRSKYRLAPALALAAAAGLMLTATAGAQEAARPLRVGFVCPFTGGSADFGNSARLGAELAAQEINEVGGYLGRKIELVERDDQADPARGRAIAEELVTQEKVDFTVGYCNTGVALNALDVFQSHQSLLMVPVSTGSAVTAKYPPAQSFIFRMSPPDTLQAVFLINEIVDKRHLRKVAVFADTTGYGEGGLKDLTRFLAQRGLAPTYVARFPLGVKTLVDEVERARAAGAEAIVGYTVGPEEAVLARARADAHFAGPLLGPWPMSFRTVWDQSGGAAEGAVMVQSIIQDISNERRSSFIARLEHLAGGQRIGSLMAAAQSYDAVQLMVRAVFQSRGDTAGPVLKTVLENLDRSYAGAVATHHKPFSITDHEAFSMNMIWLGVWRHGEVQFYYPQDARDAAVMRQKSAS
jgi:branched-chain amino acid transport system substrate-binding protein